MPSPQLFFSIQKNGFCAMGAFSQQKSPVKILFAREIENGGSKLPPYHINLNLSNNPQGRSTRPPDCHSGPIGEESRFAHFYFVLFEILRYAQDDKYKSICYLQHSRTACRLQNPAGVYGVNFAVAVDICRGGLGHVKCTHAACRL